MNREEKAAAVAELSEDLKGADAIFAVDYRGISVSGSAELRRKLAEADAAFKVVKNRLAKRAAADAGTEAIDDFLVGPTALTLVHGDAVVAAKAITTFARQNEVLEFKGGIMDGQPLDPDGFKAIARLPGRDVLHGQLVGIAASPLTGLARGLGSLLSGLAVALGQISEQGLVGGEAPPESAAAEETADEPAAEEGTPEGAAEEQAPAEQTEARSQGGGEETSNEEKTDGAEDAPAGEAEAGDEESKGGEQPADSESEEASG